MPAHAHERDLIVLVLSGCYVEACRGSAPQARRPMSLVYLPAGLPHAERHEAAGRRLIAETPLPSSNGSGRWASIAIIRTTSRAPAGDATGVRQLHPIVGPPSYFFGAGVIWTAATRQS